MSEKRMNACGIKEQKPALSIPSGKVRFSAFETFNWSAEMFSSPKFRVT